MHEHSPEPLFDRQGLEQRLALRGLNVDVAGHEVGELAGLVHTGEHLLDDLLRQAGLLAQLGRAHPGLTMERHERRVLGVDRQHLLRLPDHRLQVAVLLAVVQRDATLLTVEQQLHAAQPPLHLTDARDGAHGVERLGRNRLHVLPLRDRED